MTMQYNGHLFNWCSHVSISGHSRNVKTQYKTKILMTPILIHTIADNGPLQNKTLVYPPVLLGCLLGQWSTILIQQTEKQSVVKRQYAPSERHIAAFCINSATTLLFNKAASRRGVSFLWLLLIDLYDNTPLLKRTGQTKLNSFGRVAKHIAKSNPWRRWCTLPVCRTHERTKGYVCYDERHLSHSDVPLSYSAPSHRFQDKEKTFDFSVRKSCPRSVYKRR